MKKRIILATVVGLLALSGCASQKPYVGKVYAPTEVSFNSNPIVKVAPGNRNKTLLKQGYLLAEGVVNAKGVFTDIKVLEMKPKNIISLKDAKKYLSKWRFKPALKDGKRVNVKHLQKWTFKI